MRPNHARCLPSEPEVGILVPSSLTHGLAFTILPPTPHYICVFALFGLWQRGGVDGIQEKYRLFEKQQHSEDGRGDKGRARVLAGTSVSSSEEKCRWRVGNVHKWYTRLNVLIKTKHLRFFEARGMRQ